MEGRPEAKADLGLTEAQQADMRKNMEATRRARLLKSTDLKVASMDLRSMLRAEKVDEKALAAKLVEVQAAQGAILKLKVDSVLAMKRILTPEQQQKMSAMRRGHGRARSHPRMTPPGSPGSGRDRRGHGRMTRPGPRGLGSPGNDPDLDLDPELDFDDFDFDDFDFDDGDDFEGLDQHMSKDIRL
jgi:Spy/CpxP family protein refolding chaperone